MGENADILMQFMSFSWNFVVFWLNYGLALLCYKKSFCCNFLTIFANTSLSIENKIQKFYRLIFIFNEARS